MKNGTKNGQNVQNWKFMHSNSTSGLLSGQHLGHFLGHFLPFSTSNRTPVAQKVARSVQKEKLMHASFSNGTLCQFSGRCWGRFSGQKGPIELPPCRPRGRRGRRRRWRGPRPAAGSSCTVSARRVDRILKLNIHIKFTTTQLYSALIQTKQTKISGVAHPWYSTMILRSTTIKS